MPFLRSWCCGIALWALLLVSGAVAQAAEPTAIKVVLDDNYPPYIFRDENGQLQGILKDIWAVWEERTGVAVDFQAMDWGKARATMERGQADVIDTIFATAERRNLYEFSAPYAAIEVPLFFHRSISGIADAASAKGFTIGVKDGDACIEFLSAQGIRDFKRYPSYAAQVSAAIAQDVRVLCIDTPPAHYFFNRAGQAEEFRHTAPLYVGEFHWAVAKGKSELKQFIEAGFARITAAERQAIETRWLGARLTSSTWEREVRPLTYKLIALGLLAALLFAWSWLLRRRVAARTAELELAKESLRELLAEQHLIFENAHVGIMLLQNRQILKCNQRIAGMFGFVSPEELLGRSTEVFYPSAESFSAAGQTGYAQLAEHGFANFETEMCRQDGTPIWVMQTGRTLDPHSVLHAPSIWVYTDITELKRSDLALQQSRQMLTKTFESCPIAASIAGTADGRFIEVNANYARDFGWTRAELLGRTSMEVGLWPDAETRARWVAAMLQEGRLINYETVWMHKSGERRDVSLSSEVMELEGRSCILAYVSDITARKRTETDLRIAAAAFESQEGMVVTDANGVILRVNQTFAETTGYSAAEAIGQTPRLLKSGRHDEDFYRQMWVTIQQTGGWTGEIWDRRKNGEIYPKWLTISAVKDEAGVVTHYIGTHFDITERKKAEERIQALAYYDPLTGLANRANLSEQLGQAVRQAARHHHSFALMLLDLDHFKAVNDSLGHHMGDRLLVCVAERLVAAVRQSDLVARLGGDEFVIILPEIESPADAAHVADKILTALSAPCRIDTYELRASPSIGICLYPNDATESQDLLQKADAAMYHAKSRGRSQYQFFQEAFQLAAVRRLALEADLRKAIALRQFLLHYQPQIDLRSGRIVGVEALIRWQHPERGIVSPLDFIPIAEETGLIGQIGDWVLEQACRQLALWRSRGIENLTMSVNLTASQFLDRSLPDRVQALLRQFGLPPNLMVLEVTESMSMASPEQTIASMKELTACGLSLSIDDFGTGYSSLNYLKLFPLRTLKIDRSFVKDIEVDQNDADICDVTVLLAHKLGLDVVAEGVETEAQLKYLLSIGCEKVQGYFFSKPLPADELEQFVRSFSPLTWLGTVDVWTAEDDADRTSPPA